MGTTLLKIIVGLGNPGEEYANTRHNVGFMGLDRLRQHLGTPPFSSRWAALMSSFSLPDGEVVYLLKPQTYMNRSGESLLAMFDDLAVESVEAEILVIVDDIHLPPGRLRLREQGSAGGHNGLASIELALASPNYARLRVGVGGAQAPDRIAHVLGKFENEEVPPITDAIAMAAIIAKDWLTSGVEGCQDKCNAWRSPLGIG